MRVLVCGGRNYSDSHTMTFVLVPLLVWGKIADNYEGVPLRSEADLAEDVIIQGGAAGADRMARDFAKANGILCEQYNADWDNMDVEPCVPRKRKDGSIYNAAAGGIRNQRMLDEGRPDVVIAFPGGAGTADMVRRALDAGVQVVEIAADQGATDDEISGNPHSSDG